MAERPVLFSKMEYTLIPNQERFSNIVKPCGDEGMKILQKLDGKSGKNIGDFQVRNSEIKMYFHRTPGYWIRFMDFLPYFKSPHGDRSIHHIRELCITDKKMADLIGCIVSSTVYFYWFFASGNCRNLTLDDVKGFPIGNSVTGILHRSSSLFSELMRDYRDNSQILRRGEAEFQEFDWAVSKPIVDKIDALLAEHYGFSKEELDFIINYDIKYRKVLVEREAGE